MMSHNEQIAIGGYKIKTNGERVILSVLVGADQSLIGLKIKNSTVISMKLGELRAIVCSIYGEVENNY